MADAHFTPDTTTSTATRTERRYTVGYAPQNGKPNPAPAINLKGHWLAELGFLTGMPVTITTEQGRLVIEVGSEG